MEKNPADSTVPGKISKTKAPAQTFEEVRYLKHLIEERIPVRVRLSDKSFHAAVLANLARHPEWRVLVLPPPKKPVPRPLLAPKAAPAPSSAAASAPS